MKIQSLFESSELCGTFKLITRIKTFCGIVKNIDAFYIIILI